jgi:hypothetical protein
MRIEAGMKRPAALFFSGLASISFFGTMHANAQAQDKCSTLQIFDTVQMFRGPGEQEFIPITVNGAKENYIFDTGGYYTQVGRPVAEDLKLPIRRGSGQLYDATGHVSQDYVQVHEFMIGHMRGTDNYFPISPVPDVDGLVALDHLASLDVDVDFGTNKLNLFSPDHCPGGVLYWTAPAVAVVPITMYGFHIIVPVTLDGQVEQALIDTGAPHSTLAIDEARRLFDLTIGATNAPENGNLNGDVMLRTYSHTFKNLSIGDIAVINPKLTLIPNAAGRNADTAQYVGDRTKSDRTQIKIEDMIIGMDVLSKLHVYIAFKEKKMYVSVASVPPPGTAIQPYPDSFISSNLQRASRAADANPDNPGVLNNRCYWRGVAKKELDAALSDCDKSLKLKPQDAATLDSRAFVLYQQGKYQEALDVYDTVLKIDPRHAASLLVRGYAKGKLGDTAGKNADIAAAVVSDPDIPTEYKRFGVGD